MNFHAISVTDAVKQAMVLPSASLCPGVFWFVFCEGSWDWEFILSAWYLGWSWLVCCLSRQERYSPQHGSLGKVKNKDSFCNCCFPKADMLRHAGPQLSSTWVNELLLWEVQPTGLSFCLPKGGCERGGQALRSFMTCTEHTVSAGCNVQQCPIIPLQGTNVPKTNWTHYTLGVDFRSSGINLTKVRVDCLSLLAGSRVAQMPPESQCLAQVAIFKTRWENFDSIQAKANWCPWGGHFTPSLHCSVVQAKPSGSTIKKSHPS